MTKGALSSAILGLVLMGFYLLSGRSRSARYRLDPGKIELNRKAMGGFALLAFAFAGVTLYAALFGEGGLSAGMLAVALGLVGYCAAAMLHPAYGVRWSAMDVTGPASYGIWPLGPRRVTIRFQDIQRAGADWADSWFVEDGAGNRIRWNRYYVGYDRLMEAVERSCPHLFSKTRT